MRPLPWQVGQGSLISVPVPWQRRQGWEIENSPCDSASTPRPLQSEQIVGWVPGLAPVPLQVGQGADSGTDTGIWAPSIACSNEMWTSVSRSRPRSGPGVRPPARPPALPNRSERMSPKPPPKPPVGVPVRNEPGSKPPPKIPPPESYALRFSASDRIEYASCTCLKRSSALASSLLRSG